VAADLKAAEVAKAAADQAAADKQASDAAQSAADLKAAAAAKMTADAAAKAAAEANTAKATSLLEQLTQYIQDNKVDLADKTLSQLDGMKDSLPASLQEKIESARTALNAKKTAGQVLK
jgi:hypothetical protein